jgi:Sulfatase
VADVAGGADGNPAPRRRRALRDEVLLALEICGLAALAVTRPVLDSFGRSPETFIARDASTTDVVLFALAVAAVPTLVMALAAAATRLAGPRARRAAQLTLVGVLGAVAAWRFGTDLTDRGRWLVVAGAAVVGLSLALARHRLRTTATYLRFLGAASVVFVAQFLVLSPTSDLVLGGEASSDHAAAADAVLAASDGEPPPIVVVVLDALPTVSLLDGTGHIDADLYPNLGALAGDATWYRNNTTVSSFTYQVMPALLSGRLPGPEADLPDDRNFPDNLFTLFAGTHDIEAVEQITRLCPDDACTGSAGTALPTLFGDAVDWWRGAAETEDDGATILPGALDPERGDDFARWVAEQDFSPGGRPGLWFYHLVMPHEPWVDLADGSPYAAVEDPPFGLFLNLWGQVGSTVGRQRHVLQTQSADRMLGELFARLHEAGTYDDTLIVVAGDHGQALSPGAPLRGLAPSQYEQVAWTPLIVKAPHQDEGVIDDANVWSIDLVPTVADQLGIELPWEADGIPARLADRRRDRGDKRVIDNDVNTIEPAPGSHLVPVDAEEGFARVLESDFVPAEGDLAVWRRGEHGDLVGRDVRDLRVAEGGAGTMAVEGLDRLEHPGDGPPTIELLGEPSLPRPGQVAVAVNGVVAAVAPIEDGGFGHSLVHALLLPEPFAADNEVTAYLVEGPPGDESLRPVAVTAR